MSVVKFHYRLFLSETNFKEKQSNIKPGRPSSVISVFDQFLKKVKFFRTARLVGP